MTTTTPAPRPRGGPPRDAHHVPLSPAQRLVQDAANAAELRAYQTDPAVVALRVENLRTQVDRLMWAGIVLGLCFTMTTVQAFAAAGAPTGSPAWFAAWLLDPMVSLVLLAVLRAEHLTTRYQVLTGPWPRVAKWSLLTATYLMNTWASWAAGSPAGVILYSVPPLVVVIAAETLTEVQYALTECAQRAARLRPSERSAQQPPPELVNPSPPPTRTPSNARSEHPMTSHREPPTSTLGDCPVPGSDDPVPGSVRHHGTQGGPECSPHRAGGFPGPTGEPPTSIDQGRPAAEQPPTIPGRARGGGGRSPQGRKLLADYLAEARAAYQPGIMVTPAWVRQVTACSRGLSSKLATTLTGDLAASPAPTTTTTTAHAEPGRTVA